jgi:hypothetical protein
MSDFPLGMRNFSLYTKLRIDLLDREHKAESEMKEIRPMEPEAARTPSLCDRRLHKD